MQQGHLVKLFIRNDKIDGKSKVGIGLVERIPHWEPWMKWADLVFCTDNVVYFHALESYRKLGYPIFGGGVAGAEMELNRVTGQELMKKAGIEILPYKVFNSYDDAEGYVRKTMGRFVSKPSGDADKALTYVSKSPADMIYMLRKWKKNPKIKKMPFVLQEFAKGVEIAIGGWFGPGGFSKYYLENFEFKKLMPGEKGVNTGEMGTVMRYTSKSKLADQMLKPMEEYLHSIGYVGYIDQNCIITEEGKAWPMEWTTRPGWPLFNIQQALHQDVANWMVDLIDGFDSFKPSEDIGLGVVIAIPDFPYSKLTKKEVSGVPVYFEPNEHHHLAELMLGEAPIIDGNKVVDKPCLVSAGDYLMIVSGTGKTVKQAKLKAYVEVDKIEIPNSPIYRVDIGDRLKTELVDLQKHGYAKDMNYA
jgi:phosphoribosylamine---glycine ligase